MPRRAYSLVELLVVVAILAVLIALLLPAVQLARQASARAQCGNNLKQIGLSWHGHHDALARFPNGGGHYWSEEVSDFGWAWQVLPWLEQDAVARSGRAGAGVRVAAYQCPLRARVRADGRRGLMCYASLYGPTIGPAYPIPASYPIEPGAAPKRVTFAAVDALGGTSARPMLAEKMLWWPRGRDTDVNDDIGWAGGWDNDTLVYPEIPGRPDCTGPTWGLIAGSSHRSGFGQTQFDGSVSFRRFGTAPLTAPTD